MTDINAATVMKLRNKTGLSMMECKKALVETAGDMDKAEDNLRKKMKGKMDSRTDRAAGEGRIAVAIKGSGAVIVELRAETDFTAKNEQFIALTQKIADALVGQPAGPTAATPAINAMIDDLRIKTGENCSFARAHSFAGGAGTVFGVYVHHDGKTGALLQAEGDISPDTLKQIGMHLVAGQPSVARGLTAADIPAEIADKERKFRLEQAVESGKPKEIAEKMVEGGMRKFFEEVALLEQPYVIDPTKKVKDVVGAKSKLVAFQRWAVGEG